MPKRRSPGRTRRLSPIARERLRGVRENLTLTQAAAQRGDGQWAADPYAPEIGETFVLATEADCTSCPTEIGAGAEATMIDGELNCAECTWEARHPHG